MSSAGQAAGRTLNRCHPYAAPLRALVTVPGRRSACGPVRSTKGFGTGTEPKNSAGPSAPATSESNDESAIERLEARMRSRRQRVEPKVKVESAAVEAVQGKTPSTPEQQAEATFVSAMLFLFGVVLLEGLVIAGSGFLPEDWDAFVAESLYPNYTSTVGLFLAASTVYGLWKIGKLPLPFLGKAPSEPPKGQ